MPSVPWQDHGYIKIMMGLMKFTFYFRSTSLTHFFMICFSLKGVLTLLFMTHSTI